MLAVSGGVIARGGSLSMTVIGTRLLFGGDDPEEVATGIILIGVFWLHYEYWGATELNQLTEDRRILDLISASWTPFNSCFAS